MSGSDPGHELVDGRLVKHISGKIECLQVGNISVYLIL